MIGSDDRQTAGVDLAARYGAFDGDEVVEVLGDLEMDAVGHRVVYGGTEAVDTTMGFTPLEGLVMATRAGSVDPGMVLWLQEDAGIGFRELSRCPGTPFWPARARWHPGYARGTAPGRGRSCSTRLALQVYVHRLRQGIASMAAALGGLDTLVFTGGSGPRPRDRGARGVQIAAEVRRVLDAEPTPSA